MKDLLDSVTRGTEKVFRSPKLAAAFYTGALVAVFLTTGLRGED